MGTKTEIIKANGVRKRREYAELPQPVDAKRKSANRGFPSTSKSKLGRFKACAEAKKKSMNELSEFQQHEFMETTNWFDSVYKRFVFYVLAKDYGFRTVKDKDELHKGKDARAVWRLRNKVLDAEEIYVEVFNRLVERALLTYDLSRKNIGKHGFRKWLKTVIKSVYSDAVRPYLVPKVDEKGNPVWKVDAKGKFVLDKKGKKIQEQVFLPGYNDDVDYKRGRDNFPIGESNERKTSGVNRTAGGTGAFSDWTDSAIARIRSRTMLIAYLQLCHANQSAAHGWRMEAMRQLYEKFVSDEEVIDALLKRSLISSAKTFYVAKCTFRDAWKQQAEKLESKIFKKLRMDDYAGASKRRKGTFRWQPLVGFDEALKIVEGLEGRIKVKVGYQRFRTVKESFGQTMLLLCQEADEEESLRNARYYR